MAGCIEKNGLNLGDLFAVNFAETLVKSMFLCTFDAYKNSKCQQILQQRH